MAKFFDRVKFGWEAFKHGAFPRPGWGSKAVPIFWPSMVSNPVPEVRLRSYTTYAQYGYASNALVLEALSYKYRAMSQVRLLARDSETNDEAPLGSPLANLLMRPNPHQSMRQLMQLSDLYLNISGNAYILLDRVSTKTTPRAMYAIRPDRISIIPERILDKPPYVEIMGYVYTPDGNDWEQGIPILPEDLIHVKLPNPLDPYEGLGVGQSPFASVAREVDTDAYVTKYLYELFSSGALIDIYLSFKEKMEPDVLEAARDRFMEKYGGEESFHTVAAMDGGGEIKHFGLNFREYGFDALDERSETRITGVLGVPVTLLNTRSGAAQATYNNKQSDRRMFWEDVFLSEIGLFMDEFKYYLRDGEYEPVLDTSGVAALREILNESIDTYVKMINNLIPPNEAIRMLGLGISEIPLGDVSWASSSLYPVGMQMPSAIPAEIPEPSDDEEDEPEEMPMADEEEQLAKMLPFGNTKQADTEGMDPTIANRIKAVWAEQERIRAGWERQFNKVVAENFEKDYEVVMAAVQDTYNQAISNSSTPNWEAAKLNADKSLQSASTRWALALLPASSGVIAASVTAMGNVLGYDPLTQVTRQSILRSMWLADYLLTFSDPITDNTRDIIKELFNSAIRDGATLGELNRQIDAVFARWVAGEFPTDTDWVWFTNRLPAYRKELIARDISARIRSGGANLLYREKGVVEQAWVATGDDRVRASHAYANGQVVGIDQPFVLGSGARVMYPGDSSMGAPLSETIQCRCIAIPKTTQRGPVLGVGGEIVAGP